MIYATIIGRLGRDASQKTAGGQQLIELAVASDTPGKRDAKPVWVRVNLWGKRDALLPHLTKGTQVACAGELTEWTGTKGGRSLELRCNSIQLLGGGQRSEPRAEPVAHPVAASVPEDDFEEGTDDLPF